MRIPRVYHHGPLALYQAIVLNSDATKHISLVLRLSVKQQIILFNSLTDTEYLAEIVSKDKNTIVAKILTEKKVNTQAGLMIHLVQSVCRNDKMDWIIQKATELGVSEITPVITDHCTFKPLKKTQTKMQHWQKISISSCEQSGRCYLPKIHEFIFLSHFLDQINAVNTYLCLDVCQTDSNSHRNCSSQWSFLTTANPQVNPSMYYLLIGPEGGFSQAERKQLHGYAEKFNNFHIITLGRRILRTETAGIAAIVALQTLVGDFR